MFNQKERLGLVFLESKPFQVVENKLTNRACKICQSAFTKYRSLASPFLTLLYVRTQCFKTQLIIIHLSGMKYIPLNKRNEIHSNFHTAGDYNSELIQVGGMYRKRRAHGR